MPDTMTGAAVLSMIDMLVVFGVLTGLVAVLLIEHRVVGRRPRPGAGAEGVPAGGTPAEVTQVLVTMAAYLGAEDNRAVEASRNGPPAPDGAAAWAAAGRRAMMEKRRQVQGGLGR